MMDDTTKERIVKMASAMVSTYIGYKVVKARATSNHFVMPKVSFTVTPDINNSGGDYDAVRTVCRLLVPSWQADPECKIDISLVTGGITNRLYRVEIESKREISPSTLLVRVYGEKTEVIIDRPRENKIFTELTQMGFGIKLIGLFDNGRIEQWFGGRTLCEDDLPNSDIQKAVATRLSDLHNLKVACLDPTKPILWDTLFNWYEVAKACTFSDFSKNQQFQSIGIEKIEKELNDLKSELSKYQSPIVFAHNDCLAGNIMIKDSRMELIDLEYAGYNYRGFDIGNHFCEYSGFDFDQFDDKYPDEKVQRIFLQAYLEASNGFSPSKMDIDKLYIEVNKFSLASHLFWGLWAIVQAKNSTIDFNFMKYGVQRIQTYFKYKEKFKDLQKRLTIGNSNL